MGADLTKQGGAGNISLLTGRPSAGRPSGPPPSVGLSSEDPSKGVVASNCLYPDAVFFNFYREIYLRQEGAMAPKSPLDEPVISGPFSLYEGSFILEFLEPHPSRDAT